MRIITGRAFSCIREMLYSEIKNNSKEGIRQILLVPETNSHEAERELCSVLGDSGCLYAEALTFKRLSNRVFSEAGGLSETVLDKGGRLLIMKRALDNCADSLKVFKGAKVKPAFLESLVKAVEEFKSGRISPEDILKSLDFAESKMTDRLKDLALIYSEYIKINESGLFDPNDVLSKTALRIGLCEAVLGKDVYFDNFEGFTAQEFSIIGEILKLAGNVTFTLLSDGIEDFESGFGVFSKTKSTAKTLISLAESQGVTVNISEIPENKLVISEDILFLEGSLFDYSSDKYLKGKGSIEVFEAAGVFSECEYAASKIKELVYEKDYRYRDILITVRKTEDYSDILETVFERYDIPLFLSKNNDVLKKNVFLFLISALDTVLYGYSREHLFKYLRTGLSDIPEPDIDVLENYAISWGKKGSAWTDDKEWTQNPEGYTAFNEHSKEKLKIINDIRVKAVKPLKGLYQSVKKAENGHDFAVCIYSFAEDTGLYKRLKQKSEVLRTEGKKELAEEYLRLWDIFIMALEQCAAIIGSLKMDALEFSELFKVLISQYDLGYIPASLDRVTASGIDRLPYLKSRAVFVLGANDGILPFIETGGSVLNDRDREFLFDLGFNISPGAEKRAVFEQLNIYKAFTHSTAKLFVSYPRTLATGEAAKPSFLINRLFFLFPNIKKTKEEETGGIFRVWSKSSFFEAAFRGESPEADSLEVSAFNYFSENAEFKNKYKMSKDFYSLSRGPLKSGEVLRKLYGGKVRLSASKIDKYNSCRFSHFMKYTLKAKERRRIRFEAPEIGTFIHYVLEQSLKFMSELPGGFNSLTDDDVVQICCKFVELYTEDMSANFKDTSQRFNYIFSEVQKSVEAILLNTVEELKSSQFTPLAFELDFSEKGSLPPVTEQLSEGSLLLSGKADRIDGYVKDGKLYLRVVDYKTGVKSFSFTDIWHGLNIQMLLYLFCAKDKGLNFFRTLLESKGMPSFKEIIPAGVLYVPAKEPLIQLLHDEGDKTVAERVDSLLKRSGLLIDDIEILAAMEKDVLTKGRFIPVKIKKDGTISDVSPVYSFAQLEALNKFINNSLKGVGTSILNGNIETDPYIKSRTESACGYCDYRSACHFDESREFDRMRYLYPVKRQDFFRLISGEVIKDER